MEMAFDANALFPIRVENAQHPFRTKRISIRCASGNVRSTGPSVTAGKHPQGCAACGKAAPPNRARKGATYRAKWRSCGRGHY